MFLDAGFDVHVVNASSKNDYYGPVYALIDALCAENGVDAEKTANLLLNAGLDIDEPDVRTSETPLLFMARRIGTQISYRRERATRYLMKKGEDNGDARF